MIRGRSLVGLALAGHATPQRVVPCPARSSLAWLARPCLAGSGHAPAWPRRAMPCLPCHAPPSLVSSGRAIPPSPRLAMSHQVSSCLPCLVRPGRALPSRTTSRHACHAVPSLVLSCPCHTGSGPAWPGRTMPALPCLVLSRRA